MKITVVENLGDKIAYGKDEVRVLKSLYDKVPSELKRDFDAILECAYTTYRSSVAEEKAKGNRPNAAFLKKQSLDNVRKWLRTKSILDEPVKRVVSTNPRIPKNNEVTRVVQKQSYFVDVTPTEEDIADLFDNFDSNSLSDEFIEKEPEPTLDLGDDLFEDLDILDGLEDF